MLKNSDLADIIAPIGFIDTQSLLIDYIENHEGENYGDFLKKIKNKSVIADIGAGFGIFQNYLNEISNDKMKIFCIDPVYDDINSGLIKVVDFLKIHINAIVDLCNNPKYSDYFEDLYKKKFFLEIPKCNSENWIESEGIEYKNRLQGNEKIDVAFMTELYRELPKALDFLINTVNSLNSEGELYIFDESNNDFMNIAFLHKLLERGYIDGYDNGEGKSVFKIVKEDFINNIEEIKSIFINGFSNFLEGNSSLKEMIAEEGVEEKIKIHFENLINNQDYSLQLSSNEFVNLRKDYYPYWNFPEGTQYNLRIAIINEYDLIKNNLKEGNKYIELKLLDGKLEYKFIKNKDDDISLELEEAIRKLSILQEKLGI